MWRRPLNSIALAAATHKGFEKVSDGTSTRVMDWTINKWRAKITWRELYNVRDLPKGRGHKICRENTVILRKVTVIKSKRNIIKNHSPRTFQGRTYVHHICLFIALPCSLTILTPLRVSSTSLKPSFLANSTNLLYWALWALIHSSVGLKSQSPPL